MRGRSRVVSKVALARQASEERKLHSQKSADAPTEPPLEEMSLEDQLHAAYSRDDIHQAKVILLKLKGVSPTPANLARVRPEDFDECFMPNGGLSCGERVEEMQRKQREIDWENHLKRVWDQRGRQKLSYDSISTTRRAAAAATSKKEQPLTYTFMITPSMRRLPSPKKKRTRPAATTPKASTSTIAAPAPPIVNPKPPKQPRADPIPFKDVLAAMRGPLFGLESEQHARSPSRRQQESLDILFEPVKRDPKGKGKEREFLRPTIIARRNSCVACSLASTAPSPSPLSSRYSSRTNSWLSFDGSGASSASTVLTTPSTSPPSTGKSFSSWLKSPLVVSPLSEHPPSLAPPRHSCGKPHSKLIPISVLDAPLTLIPNLPAAPVPPSPSELSQLIPPTSSKAHPSGLFSSVSHLLSLARSFQNAYVGAVVFAAVPSVSYEEPQDCDPSPKKSKGTAGQKRALASPGYRASPSDVSKFSLPFGGEGEQYGDIPLPVWDRDRPTVQLSSVPDLSAIFPSQPPCRPALPVIEAPPPPAQPRFRYRCIANPIYLRLMAHAHNHPGEGPAMMPFGCVQQERMLGVAWDGKGASWLRSVG